MSIMRSASFEYAPHSIASVKLLVSQTAPLAAFCAGGLFIKLDRTMPLDRTTGVATPLSKSITVIHTCAVHLMICSMMTSAMLMFVIGRLSEAEVLRWAKHHCASPPRHQPPPCEAASECMLSARLSQLVAYELRLHGRNSCVASKRGFHPA